MTYEPRTYKAIAFCVDRSGRDLVYRVVCDDKEICYRTAYPLKSAAEALRSWRHNANMEDIITLQHGDGEKSPITIRTTIGRALEIKDFSRDLAMAAGKDRS
jgi:hypothetical protein